MRAERTKQTMIDASVVRVPGRAPWWIVPTVKVSLIIADALAAAVSFMLAFYMREGVAVFADQRFCMERELCALRCIAGVCSLYSAY